MSEYLEGIQICTVLVCIQRDNKYILEQAWFSDQFSAQERILRSHQDL